MPHLQILAWQGIFPGFSLLCIIRIDNYLDCKSSKYFSPVLLLNINHLILLTLFQVSEAIFVITSGIKDVCGKPPTERLFLDKYGKICLCLDEIVWKVSETIFYNLVIHSKHQALSSSQPLIYNLVQSEIQIQRWGGIKCTLLIPE